MWAAASGSSNPEPHAAHVLGGELNARNFLQPPPYPGGVVWLSLAGYDPGNPDPYLWVLDNVPVLLPESERDGILAFWRSPTASGRTLVTTRDSRPAAGVAAQRLDVLGDDDALRLLARYRRPSSAEEAGARELVPKLTLYMMGDIAGARALNERSVEIYRRVLGDEHPDTLRTMGNLGLILQTQGHLANARDLQQRVLETQCRVLGDEHPQTVMSLNNLALTVHSQGRFLRTPPGA